MAETFLIPTIDSNGNQVRDSNGNPVASTILAQTVAEAVLAAVEGGKFPWVDWEAGEIIVVTDSSGAPVIDSNGDFVTSQMPYGYIAEQDYADYWYGTYASGLRLVASAGYSNPTPETLAVPNVVGLPIAAARAALAAVFLATSGFTWVASTEPGGTVVTQSPAANTAVLPGSPVYLSLSLGSSP